MNLDDARKVAMIAEEADNNCYVCVQRQAELLSQAFPEFVWTYISGEDREEIRVTERDEKASHSLGTAASK